MGNRCESAICESHSDATINAIWNLIGDGQRYRDPDAPHAHFEATHEHGRPSLLVAPHDIRITKNAFVAALHYLVENEHDLLQPCEILSHSDPQQAGPLCRATRDENANVQCVGYILSILASRNIVRFDEAYRKVWLTHAFLHAGAALRG